MAGIGDLGKAIHNKVESLRRSFKSFEANRSQSSMKHLKRGPGSPAGPKLKPAKNKMPMSEARKKNKAR